MNEVDHEINNTHFTHTHTHKPTHTHRGFVGKTNVSKVKGKKEKLHIQHHPRNTDLHTMQKNPDIHSQAPACLLTPYIETQGHMKQKALPAGTAWVLGGGVKKTK